MNTLGTGYPLSSAALGVVCACESVQLRKLGLLRE